VLIARVVSLLLITATVARAQTPTEGDTATHTLSSVIVTADRVSGILGTQTAMANRLTAETLRNQPIQRVSESLRNIPGLIVIPAGAMGEQPRLVMRGFYGGGETEYAAVLLDGVPLGALSSGVVNWDIIPLSAIRAIEVVRGPASALYGDAAVGGVINIQTTGGSLPARWRIAAGSYGIVDANAAWSGDVGRRSASVYGGRKHSTGYRAHEGGDASTLGGSIEMHRSVTGLLRLSGLYHDRDYDDPGPLPEILLADSRRASVPYFRFDRSAERMRRLSLDGWTAIGEMSRVSGHLTGEGGTADLTRTLQLAPDFADTRSRTTRARRALGTVQLETRVLQLPWPQRIVAGTDVSAGRLSSEYRPLIMGGPTEYETEHQAGDVDVSGSGTRTAAALFMHWEHRLANPLRAVVGGRFDWLRDTYEPTLPTPLARTTTLHREFSPKLGLNLSYLETTRQAGNVYLSATRSFKAPSLDQLFDQRPIPIPVEPFSVSISNPELRPQRGAGIEGGLIHRATNAAGNVLEATLAVYRQKMRDELDFDIEQFRYVNIGQSLHRGIEFGARLEARGANNVFATFTRQDVLVLNGPNSGRQLKAVPRQIATAGIATKLGQRLQTGINISDVRGAFIDDANSRRLPGYTRVDARLSSTFAAVRLTVDALNVFNRAYVSTGFPDPSGTNVVYYHPAAGRVLLVGIMSAW
jgi:outer membrane receptor protein involved in Fe transport